MLTIGCGHMLAIGFHQCLWGFEPGPPAWSQRMVPLDHGALLGGYNHCNLVSVMLLFGSSKQRLVCGPELWYLAGRYVRSARRTTMLTTPYGCRVARLCRPQYSIQNK